MSSAASRKAAVARARKARNRHLQDGVSALDDYEIKDEGDVYDVVDESQYHQLVESRREREDFVVDDDGLGYYDDGEERLGAEDDDEDDIKNRKRTGTNALTAAAMKKARKTNADLKEKKRKLATEENNNASGNMWNFVSRGQSNAAAASTGTGTSSIKKRSHAASSAVDIDSMLNQLDDTITSAPAARRPSHRTYGRSSSAARSTSRGRSSARSRRVSRQADTRMDTSTNDDDDDDDFGGAWDNDNDDNEADAGFKTPTESTTPSTTPAKDETTTPSSATSDTLKHVRFADTPPEDEEEQDGKRKTPPVDAENESANKPVRKRLARSKLGKISAPAKAALEQQKQQQQTGSSQKQNALATTAPSAVDTTSASFKPDNIAAESTEVDPAAAANLESILQQDKDGGDNKYLDMFWTDVCERDRTGEMLLFGKVAVEKEINKKVVVNYISCCVVVKGNVRNLFVLPKLKSDDDDEYESMMDVHGEIKTVLQPKCVPLKAGVSWAGKVVTRKYAFEDPSIPRDETQYLKVVYNAKYPVPDQDVCQNGGKYFSRILGAGASNMENFIIKRKLMGPCWIRITNPTPNGAPVSWCKLELQVPSPKTITRLDLVESGVLRPPPPIVSVSLKLKTVVNPKTHKSEIVSVSAICHRQVLLDTASDESTRHMTQLSLIRPLGNASNGALPQFPRDIDQEIARNMPQLQKMPNERALLSRLMAQIGTWDPDVFVGHNAWGFDMQVLLSRCVEHKVSMWSKVGRCRQMRMPSAFQFSSGKDWAIANALHGRVLCDTYLSSKELLRETTYSLTNLAATQLKTQRTDIEPVDIPQWYNESKTIVQLAAHTLNDAQLVQRLMFKLQILPLTKQLTCVAGNVWSHTMKGNRAERTEYLLLHEFHKLKYIAPEKRKKDKNESGRSKAKYSGGLVLEPKKGYYDSFILLLDFNSLYPSIIQEYNLCFTTMNWADFQNGVQVEGATDTGLPPVPDESLDRGVLPRVIKSLVDRRRTVKKLMQSEKDAEKKDELDIRQKALKLTANSMYGCLGFSHSRFYAQPIAALVTAMGRETLQRTVDIAEHTVGLDVIYGDTDSIMINTRITDVNEFSKVMGLGNKVKMEVNRLYKTLELEIDGTFRSMLLLKKKKYAAVTCDQGPNGLVFGKETKGLDLVRRDWCIQSKDTGRYVLDQILSGDDRELVVNNIHDHLDQLAKTMRDSDLPLEKYVITKGLSKHPNDYPDGKTQPHVHVAKMMLKNNRPVNTGDHIPYVITAPLDDKEKAPPVTERARHPDEIKRSNGQLKPDVEWYLTQQILPPTARLCEPIDGTSQSILAEKLGLDSSNYHQMMKSSGAEIDDEELVDYTPASCLADEERFKDVEKLHLQCAACGEDNEFQGVFHLSKDASGSNILTSGLSCPNPDCMNPEFWGHAGHVEVLARASNAVSALVHRSMKQYYNGVVRCDDPACSIEETRQISVAGTVCLGRGCTGKVHAKCSERSLHNQLKYLDSLFDLNHACDQLVQKKYPTPKNELVKSVSKHDKATFEELHETASKYMRGSAFNWIEASLWQSLFGGGDQPTSNKQ